jgi:hypothetical protein
MDRVGNNEAGSCGGQCSCPGISIGQVTAVAARHKEGGPTQTHGRTHVRVASPTGGEVVMSSRWD